MKILLVEDDQATAVAVAAALTAHHYRVNVATDGKTALAFAEAFAYDLVLLDVLIPEIDGISVCRHLRSQGDSTPILLLTAKDTSSDRVLGLDAGADDYVVKPFNVAELLARIRALLRRATAHVSSVITWENLRLDIRTGEIHYGSTLLKLTPKEHGILELFLFNPRQIFSRSVMLDKLWNLTESPGEDTVTTHIKALRQKLKAAGAPKDLIESVYGLGYRFLPLEDAAVAAAAPPPDRLPAVPPPSVSPPDVPPPSVQPQIEALLGQLWEKFKAGFLVQVDGLVALVAALAAGSVTPEQYHHAQLDVHKLKGALGIFGYPHGSVLALEIEQVLRSPLPLPPDQIALLRQRIRELQTELNHPPVGGGRAIAEGGTPMTHPPPPQAPQPSAPDLHQQIEWQRLVMEITQRIRQSLDLEAILKTTVVEVRQFLHTDRVLIFRFDAQWKGTVVTESVGDPWRSLLALQIYDPCFAEGYVAPFQQGQITAKPDIHTAGIDACHLALLTSFQVRANLVVPILQGDNLWGLLIAHHCAAPRQWQPLEVDLLRQLATQVGLAIQQADLFAQVQIELSERRRTEEALRQSEERWQLAIAGSKDGIWDYDFRSSATFLSEHCLSIMGQPLEAVDRFEKWLSFVHPDDLAVVVQAWEAHRQGHSPAYRVECRLRRADGTYRWIQVRGQAVGDETGQPVRAVGSVTDISDRKQAEAEIRALNADLEQRVLERTQELRSSMAEVSDLYTNAPCGYHSLAADGTFIRINDTELAWLGYAREDILHQKKFADLLTPASLRVFQAHFPIFKQRGWVNDLEFEMICKDGSILPVSLNSTTLTDADGHYVMSRSSLFDIRVRKQTEEALREAERRWRSLLEHVRLVVVGLDRTGQVEFANPFFLEVTGYSLPEVLGQDWVTTFQSAADPSPIGPPIDQPNTQQSFYETLGQAFHAYSQTAILTKSGDSRLIAWNHTRLRTAKGDVIGTMSIGEDITQRQAIERLKDEFISIVSHELRTPLTSLRGALGLLATGVLNDAPVEMHRMIEIAALDTERLVRLVNDILDLERLASGKIALSRTTCPTLPLLQRSQEVMQPSAQEAGVTLVMATTTAPSVWADCDRLIQTLTNLLSNAIKFSPPGSAVVLSTALIKAGASLRQGHWTECSQAIPDASRQDCVLFQVQDHGRGIPADKLESVFGRFQQVDASDARLKGGTGLGLAICQSIVQQHGGEIWVESSLGQGSTFFFTMPLPPQSV